jgi:hypothetical protein
MGLHKASSIDNKQEEKQPNANKSTTSSKGMKDWDIPLPDLDARPATRAA